MRYLFAEVRANRRGIRERVFHYIMKQPGRNRDGVQTHIGQNVCDFQRMNQIGFAGGALLALVLARRKQVSAPQQIEVGLRMIASYFLADFFDSDHKNICQLLAISCQSPLAHANN